MGGVQNCFDPFVLFVCVLCVLVQTCICFIFFCLIKLLGQCLSVSINYGNLFFHNKKYIAYVDQFLTCAGIWDRGRECDTVHE